MFQFQNESQHIGKKKVNKRRIAKIGVTDLEG